MNHIKSQLDAIIQARSLAAQTLVTALSDLDKGFSEMALAEKWLRHIRDKKEIFPFGWYSPPPDGLSVLIGEPCQYNRLRYNSLRESVNWPSDSIFFNRDCIIYPYFSAVDRKTLMIGDHVGTYYAGNDIRIRQWFSEVYNMTIEIARRTRAGMAYSEIHAISEERLGILGAQNNTYSSAGGLASDIGHSVPFFGLDPTFLPKQERGTTLSDIISRNRQYVSRSNNNIIADPCAFTIEPQVVVDGLPMASFHIIVVIFGGELFIVERFRNVFDYFGMSEWIYGSNSPGGLG
jgi:hypothetical protein